MTALKSTNLDILTIRNAVGYPSTDIGTLCTCDNINKWSRFRPGYWAVKDNLLIFIKPRGGNNIDPRGIDSEINDNKEGFKYGDFRGYDPNSEPPYVIGEKEITINPSSSQQGFIDVEMTYYLSNVDWFNEEIQYRGRNNFLVLYSTVCIRRKDTNAIIGKIEKSQILAGSKYCTITIKLPVPTSTETYTIPVDVGLGQIDKYWHTLPFSDRIYTIKRNLKPSYIISIEREYYAELKLSIIGLDDVDQNQPIGAVIIDGGQSDFPASTIVHPIKNVKVTIIFFNSGHSYVLNHPRWSISGIQIYRKNGNYISTSDWSNTWQSQGNDTFSFNYDFGRTCQDGDVFLIQARSFGTVVATRINH